MSVPGPTAILLPRQCSCWSAGSWLTTATPSSSCSSLAATANSCKHVLCALALGKGVVVGGATSREERGGALIIIMYKPQQSSIYMITLLETWSSLSCSELSTVTTESSGGRRGSDTWTCMLQYLNNYSLGTLLIRISTEEKINLRVGYPHLPHPPIPAACMHTAQ